MSKIDDKEKILEIKIENLNLSKKSLETILENIRVIKKRLSNTENILLETYRSQYSPSREVPGEIGFFDGEYLVTKEGMKYEVPKSYAAKSLLIVGDELKKYKEDGEDKFKIVNKIPRKKVKGILSKKDGRYVVLLDNGKSYNLSKNAVEFRNLKQGDEVIVVIPEAENNSDYAAIDKVAPKIQNNSQDLKKAPSVKSEPKQSEKDTKNKSEEKLPTTSDKVTNIKPNVEFTDEDLL